MRRMVSPSVGQSVPRKEALAKVTGQARYVDDVTLPGMIHGVTVRSSCARGRILGIRFAEREGVPWDEIVVVTAKDVPHNVVALLVDDQPALAETEIRHPEEPVLLLAHPDRLLLERARAAVTIEVEPLPAVFTLDESLARVAVVWGEDNVFKEYWIRKGDVEAAMAQGDLVVVEGDYRTGAQEQLYIEPNGMIAAEEHGGITVWGSMQCPYYVQKALTKLFDLPPEKARVVQLETGGGFGGKEEYPSILAVHAALLARKSGRPVKMIYDRAEDMAATTKRHPSRTRHRTAVTRDGRIVAMDIDFVLDGGAYATLSQVVLSRGAIHAVGPYDVENVRLRARAVATCTPPHGAFRGFGAPQSLFALERHMDRIAHRLGLSPGELRTRNFTRKGRTLATGQVVADEVDMARLLERALSLSGWHEKRARFQEQNASGREPVLRGMGMASFLHGTGFTGAGEKHLASIVAIEGTDEGRFRVLAASTEIGQGTSTIFAQIAADALGVAYADVDVATPDTRDVPNSGPTVASRTCAIVGKLVEQAAVSLKAQLVASGALREPAGPADVREACAKHTRAHGRLRATAQYTQPAHLHWDEQGFRGDAYGAYSWAVYIAQVAVDRTTYEARVEDFWAVQEVGKVIHPLLAAGQIEGGVAQGIGWALFEDVVWKQGRMQNDRMTDYIVPTSVDMPPVQVVFAPGDSSEAKGIGELPMDGPAPAILNAIFDATGVAVDSVPATPEVILEAMGGDRV
jgi:CO/xanthine dehydrogenase Mo-binding subunit